MHYTHYTPYLLEYIACIFARIRIGPSHQPSMSGPPVVLKCALSGESPPTDPVVPPSGFLCSRRLLLSKLSENGGVDPFDSSSTPRTLDESALVDLRTGPSAAGADVMPPRLPAAASLPSLLDQIQASHDAVLLELYEARSALEETRRELSQALYQNDAAVRVVARLAMERDGAREQLAAASARFDSTAASATENGGGTKKRFREGEDAGAVTGADGGEGPAPKRAMVDEANGDKGKSDGSGAEGSKGNIPKADFDVMFSVWEKLNNTRKKSKKSKKGNAGGEAGANATVTLDAVRTYKKMKQKSLHKSSVKAGVLDLAYAPGIDLLVTGGRDKQTVLYSVAEGKIVATLQPGTKVDVGAVDVQPDGEGGATVATGSPDGLVFAYTVPAAGSGGSCTQAGSVDVDDGSPIVGVSVHQSAKYVVAATRSGKIGILALREGGDLELVALFSGDAADASEYTCGGLHADGLIYAAGTADGDIVVWDLNSQTVASTMKVSIDCRCIAGSTA